MELMDIYTTIVENETLVKIAHIKEAYKDDEEMLRLIDGTLDLLKKAQVEGKVPELSGSEALSIAVELATEERMEKSAEDWEKIGEEVAQMLEENFNITAEDIEKISSDEEADTFGRFCARLYATVKTGENYLEVE
jgi:predicted 3-demethylubiquinone-9 3-methyltransferase (glyoxalase superfamily)